MMKALGWDEELPGHLKADWKEWFDNLMLFVSHGLWRKTEDLQCHLYDDSEKAYAAVTYARQEYEDGTERIQLVTANSG